MKARLPQGYGKQNMNDIMARAQEMQENVRKKQDELEAEVYTIKASGDIEITMTGKHQITGIKINPELVDKDDIEMLEDMIAAAVNETVRSVDEAADTEMEKLTSAYNIPGLG